MQRKKLKMENKKTNIPAQKALNNVGIKNADYVI